MTARVVAVANHKGGVGKTTTALHLAAALAELDAAVLAVDLDPQGCLGYALGLEPASGAPTLRDVLLDGRALAETIVLGDEVDLAPAEMDLSGAELALLSRPRREFVLRAALEEVADSYDAIVVDCPPSLGVLTVNGLTAADDVIVPVLCETLAQRGVIQLLGTVDDVRRLTNPALSVRGIVATRFDPRTAHGRDVLRGIVEGVGLPLVGAPVRTSVRFAEAPARGRSLVAAHGPGGPPGLAAYRAIARELVGLPVDEDLLAAAGWDRSTRRSVLGRG